MDEKGVICYNFSKIVNSYIYAKYDSITK